MAILQMQRVSICALKKDRKAILEKIQSLGVMEMSQVAEDEKGFEKMDTLSARQDFEKKTHLTEAALHVLDDQSGRISRSHFRERRSDTKCQHSDCEE